MDNIVLWCGESLAEMPRERLIEIISELGHENRQLSDELLRSNVGRVRDIAEMGKRLQHAKKGWLLRLLTDEPA